MVILNEAKPKYDKLNELLEPYLLDIRFSNQVNIVIDLKEVLKKFFRPDISIENSQKTLIEEISSDILNIVGHYRNYFYKNGKYTTFYFVYSFDKCDIMISENAEYKKEYYEKYLNNENQQAVIAKKAAQVIERVCRNLPNVEFIESSKYDEFLVTKYLVSVFKQNELSIILTNDMIFHQLVYNQNVIILNLKGIKTELINFKNVLNILSKKDDIQFSANLYPLVLSIAGVKKYSITSVPGCAINKAITIINRLVLNDKIIDAPSVEVPIKFSELNSKDKLENIIINNSEKIISNYEFIRGDKLYSRNRLGITNATSTLENKIPSMSVLKSINAKVFTMFPLQLEMILKGERI